MSTYEDYRPCHNCGTLTDSGVCSDRCARDLDREAECRKLQALNDTDPYIVLDDGYHSFSWDMDGASWNGPGPVPECPTCGHGLSWDYAKGRRAVQIEWSRSGEDAELVLCPHCDRAWAIGRNR